MRRILIILAVGPLLLNAQDTKKIEAVNKVSVGFSLSPDYAYRTLKNNDGSSSSDLVIDFRDDAEKGRSGFTAGLNLNLKLSEKLEIQTGLFYSNKGYKTPKRATYFPTPDPIQLTHYRSKVSFNYLDVPLKLNFVSGKGKMRFIAGAGVAANFLLNESEMVTLFYADGSEKKQDQSSGFDYNKFNLTSLISAGVEFRLGENFLFRTEPTFRYGLLKIVDLPVTAHLWNLGLNVGVYYNRK